MKRVILGLETGGEHLSAALLSLDADAATPTLVAEARMKRGPGGERSVRADFALSLVAEVLARAGVGFEALSLVAVPRGPGGFTGVRVALSLAQGFGLARQLPIWPVSSLAALALNAVEPGTAVLALLDAKKGEVYAGAYRLQPAAPPLTLLAPRVGTCEAALVAAREAVRLQGERMMVLGSGALAYGVATASTAAAHIPSAAAVAELALREWAAAGFDAARAPAVDAAYLRKSEAEVAADLRDASGVVRSMETE